MEAQEGIHFLTHLRQDGLIEASGLEAAINIVAERSPSASFGRALSWWKTNGGTNQMAGFAFAKGTRWLAVIRRDEGQAAFHAACHKLRF